MNYGNDMEMELSPRVKAQKQKMLNAVAEMYNDRYETKAPKKVKRENINREAIAVLEAVNRRPQLANRYVSFSQTIKESAVVESLFKLYENSVPRNLNLDNDNLNIMRNIATSWVQEQGYDNVLNKMKMASVAMSERHSIIEAAADAILDKVDKEDPNTFVITPEMKDDFYAQLNYSDDQAITDTIKDRVSDAMTDFIDSNTKDHDEIMDILKATEDKIEKKPEDKEVHEGYRELAARKTIGIKNRSKGLFHSMVAAVCENVLKEPNVYDEFLYEGHLDMDKIVDRVALSYTFLEMLNTTRLQPATPESIQNILESYKE